MAELVAAVLVAAAAVGLLLEPLIQDAQAPRASELEALHSAEPDA